MNVQRLSVTMEPAGLPLDLVQILFSRIAERAPVTHSPPQDADLRLELKMDPKLDSESFRLEDAGHQAIRITGNSLPVLLAGAGHFLRLSSFSETGLIPASWRGISRARKPVRGVYFATHFFNYYHAAPEPAIQSYLEDLALWGFNTVMVWFDRHHFKGLSDPAAQAMLSRLRGLLGAARRLGMRVGLCVLGNEAYADSPTELRAEQGELWSFGVEMCPAKPGALDRMIREYDETFRTFSDLQPDFLAIGPYDQGGCTCPQCRPWGGRGFLRMVQHIAPVFKRYSPKGKIILSTWLFDHEHHRFKGDWPGLAQALDEKALDADMILAGTHGRQVPDYLRTHPVPGALPLLGFPEISMRGMCPWGGFGANPMPEFLAGYWAEWGHRVTGGLAYSEGIYEDLNKAIMARLFWDDASPKETIRQYIAYEFGPAVIDPLQNAIRILEANQERPWEHGDFTFPHVRLILPPDRGSQQALAALQAAERHMNPNAREGWRWRLLILRARIDAELFASQGVVSPACETCFEELTRLYHAEQADFPVHPPTRSVR